MTNSKVKRTRVKPSEVAAAYGETMADTEETLISNMIDCTEHMPVDHKKATMQFLYGAVPTCAKCGVKLKLAWVEV